MSDKSSNGKSFTFINTGTVVSGELLVENDLSIEGTVKGTIRATGVVSIHLQGVVEGEIQATAVKIGGKVTGNVTVSDRVIMESKAVLVGDIRTRELVIQEGAIFQGKCDMQPSQIAGGKH
ncbi:MAG: polymer-forming cytoskeletal protein [Fibrobacterota bacterium]|nr:polymer-forming cytoskeletal protein [Fibrobacterota bacterium]QQS06308.1 MAG: polymer-forming cytoskeletal protein [Fibrobacterota bacterium]